MAFNNPNNNSNNNEYSPIVYSAYATGNSEGIDPSQLNYSFVNRLLKISISPLKQDNGNEIAYDHQNAAVVWLTHTKARTLVKEIKKVLNGEITNGGVVTGSNGLIRFSDGKELGIDGYCLIINKLNEDGEIQASYSYQFKKKHHYGVENFNPQDSSHKKVYYDLTEIDQLMDLLTDYSRAMSGAMAYSVLDYDRRETGRFITKIDLIMSKLGVEYKTGMTSRSSQSSFFSKNDSDQGRTMRSSTMDDLE